MLGDLAALEKGQHHIELVIIHTDKNFPSVLGTTRMGLNHVEFLASWINPILNKQLADIFLNSESVVGIESKEPLEIVIVCNNWLVYFPR